MKKIFLIFAACFACTLSTFAHDFEVDGIYYNYLGGDSVEVTHKGKEYDSYSNEYFGAVDIPNTIKYNGRTFRVTTIGGLAFCFCSKLTALTIPNSVTTAGYVGLDNSKITTPVFNEHVFVYLPPQYEGEYIIPNGIKTIAGSAFANCSTLTSVIIGEDVTTIGNSAFLNCSALTSVSIGNNVISIGSDAFNGCSSLKYNRTDNAAYLGNKDNPYYALMNGGNNGQTSVTFHEDTKIIADKACFRSFSSTYSTTLIIPKGVVSIGTHAFSWNSMLGDVYLPDSLITIGSSAFAHSSVNINSLPKNVTTIGGDAFHSCIAQKPLYNQYIFAYMPSTIASAYHAYAIPNGIKVIANNAFEGCNGLTSITIPNSVTTIGNEAFSGCSGLTSINIPNSVTEMGKGAFSGCSGLTSFSIPEKITTISSGMLGDCEMLTTLTIPHHINMIGTVAFSGCKNLTSITLPDSLLFIRKNVFWGCTGLDSIAIPDHVLSLGEAVFGKCTKLRKVKIGTNLQFMDTRVFEDCDSLQCVVWNAKACKEISNTTTQPIISPFVRYNSYSKTFNTLIDTFIFGDSVVSVPQGLCAGMQKLTHVSIPNNIQDIPQNIFDSCPNLTSLMIDMTNVPSVIANNLNLTTVTIGYNVKDITGSFDCESVIWNARSCTAKRPFGYSGQVKSFIFGDSVASIPAELCCNMQKLEAIKIPNSVTHMGEYAFANCSKMRTLHIGSGLKEYPKRAFSECTGLINITVRAEMPPFLQPSTFYGVSTTAMLHVPCTSVNSYKAASYWNTFTNYEESFLLDFLVKPAEPEQGSTLIIQHPTCQNITAIFKAIPNNGYVFKEWSDGNIANPRTEYISEDIEYIAIFEKNSATTAINDISIDNVSSVRKVLEDGTLYIVKPNGEKYTIDGRKVK